MSAEDRGRPAVQTGEEVGAFGKEDSIALTLCPAAARSSTAQVARIHASSGIGIGIAVVEQSAERVVGTMPVEGMVLGYRFPVGPLHLTRRAPPAGAPR